MTKLTPNQLQILREVAGDLPPSPWGAWVGACLESLSGNGYITRKFHGKLTEKGRAALSETQPSEGGK